MRKSENKIKDYKFSSNGNHAKQTVIVQSQIRDKTQKVLFFSLLLSLLLMLVMLIYVVNEWLVVRSATTEYLDAHYQFGENQPFYRESSENYLRFIVRFITIYGLITLFGITAIALRKAWLYLLIILMSLISIAYFFIL